MRALLASIPFAFSLLPCALFAQGLLTPPGPPAPLFKTLQQVEPRTPISSLPFTISQSGSYYLVTNLTQSSATDGITIGTSDVTIDLNGFALIGTNSIFDGIVTSGIVRTNICVRNGTIRNWRIGLNAGITRYSLFEELRVLRNANHGLLGGESGYISHCIASTNGADGIRTGLTSVVEECLASGNATNGIAVAGRTVVRHCQAVGNGGDGIFVYAAGTYAVVTGCFATGNVGDGIEVQINSLVQDNQCVENGPGAADGAGIHVVGERNRIESNHVSSNDRGIDVDAGNNLVSRNMAAQNGINYDIAVNNMVGPTNLSGTVVTNHPWANFSF